MSWPPCAQGLFWFLYVSLSESSHTTAPGNADQPESQRDQVGKSWTGLYEVVFLPRPSRAGRGGERGERKAPLEQVVVASGFRGSLHPLEAGMGLL